MQIRIQGRQVQLIRSPYDSTKKRCVQQVIHSFDAGIADKFNPDQPNLDKFLSAQPGRLIKVGKKWVEGKAGKTAACPPLTDVERGELVEYLTKCHADRVAAHLDISVQMIDDYAIRAADKIATDGIEKDRAEKIWTALVRLEKALKNAGFPKSAMKPGKADKAGDEVSPAQPDLLDPTAS